MKYTLEEAKRVATHTHHNKYDYSRWQTYTSTKEKITIICPEHGTFVQRLSDHLAGCGCPTCGKLIKSQKLTATLDKFISDATSTHGDDYDYSLWTQQNIGWHVKVPIICKQHGVFYQLLGSHINGRGCIKCANIVRTNSLINSKQYNVDQATKIHNIEYDYSLVPDKVKEATPITIGCPIHNTQFTTSWNQHISSGVGCPLCSTTVRRDTEFMQYGVEHHKQRHFGEGVMNKLLDASWLNQVYTTEQKTVGEIANLLGCDVTTVHRYLNYHDIYVRKAGNVSAGERQLLAYINSVYTGTVISNSKCIIPPLELDIYLPTERLAIEFCGLYWHSDKHKDKIYHAHKTNACEAMGIRLITIFDDEWGYKQSLVKRKLSHVLKIGSSEVVYARKCTVVTLSSSDKANFLNEFHIQGNGPGSITYGLMHDTQIVAVITFINKGKGVYVLNRFATSCSVPGGFSKLVAHFTRYNDWTVLETFADLRWSVGELYKSEGFDVAYTIPPDYYWTDGRQRFHKFGFRHKHLRRKLAKYDPALTEDVNCRNNGLWKIYDCGKVKFVMTKKL